MKKSLLLLILVIFTIGCQTEITDNHFGDDNNETTLSISLPKTRTAFGEKVGETYPVYWSDGDKVVVNGVLSEEVSINKDDASKAEFFVDANISYPYHITYPHCTTTSAKL